MDTTERLRFHFLLSCIGEGNGNPLQCSCLENPRDGGAWCAAVYGVTQSWTQLKWLSWLNFDSLQFSSVQLFSHVQLFATPWTVPCQASLSITNSWSFLTLMSSKSVMPSNHFILWLIYLCKISKPLSPKVQPYIRMMVVRGWSWWQEQWYFTKSLFFILA